MTEQHLIVGNSKKIDEIRDRSIDLIVTSPPYPMIEMWDGVFSQQDSSIAEALSAGEGMEAFRKMHYILNQVWIECDRVLKDNGFVCINIGDATRTISGEFRMYSNHTEVINFFSKKGYSVLPDIHWRKQSNAPNKFMGSGMYPAGAYVTYEHEYILVFRKGSKRVFREEEIIKRRKSAYFWEERNVWFSDLWDIKGTCQAIKSDSIDRVRSAAFPLEIPYRLINMYSAQDDWVLDPFSGLGTTNLACLISQRNSYGVDLDESMQTIAREQLLKSMNKANEIIMQRLSNHCKFIDSLSDEKIERCYDNKRHGFKVKTKQEIDIEIDKVLALQCDAGVIKCQYV